MLCTTTKKEILHTVQKAYPIVPAKSTLQILSNFKISSNGSELTITATDLDHSIVTKGELSGGETFEIAVNARKVFEIIRELPDGPLQVGVEDGLFVIMSEKGFSCKIAGSDSTDFPAFPEIASGVEFDIPVADLAQMIAKSAFAASKDESRACLCGILWELDAESNTMVATDGHRLGKSTIAGSYPIEEKLSSIVAPKSLVHMVRTIGTEDQGKTVHVKLGEKYVLFSVDGLVLCSKLIDGPYPDYSRAIPSNNPKKAVVDRKLIQEALRRVCVLSNQKTNLVKFVFQNSQLELMVLNRDIAGEAREILPVEYDGPEHVIGFNGHYFSEILGIIGTDRIRMEMNTEISACLLFPESEKESSGSDDLFLIMPLRVLEEI